MNRRTFVKDSLLLSLGACVPQVFGQDKTSPLVAETANMLPLGADRHLLFQNQTLMDTRVAQMQATRMFSLLRNPQLLLGLKRITAPGLQEIFTQAAQLSGYKEVPEMERVIEAIALVEGNGDPLAQSPTGPRGLMQVTKHTGKYGMGLEINKHTDERLIPSIVVPKAAKYLQYLSETYGGLRNAVAAYHCGEFALQELQAAASKYGLPTTYPELFFADPVKHPLLAHLLAKYMAKDFGPTYTFTIWQAMELLKTYKTEPESVEQMFWQYQAPGYPTKRFQSRLDVWAAKFGKSTETTEHIHLVNYLSTKKPQKSKRRNNGVFSQPKTYSLAALGASTIVAKEVQKLLLGQGKAFHPLTIVDGEGGDTVGLLPHPSSVRAVEFVLDDLAFAGYASYRKNKKTGVWILGTAPSYSDMFREIYRNNLR